MQGATTIAGAMLLNGNDHLERNGREHKAGYCRAYRMSPQIDASLSG
jgi:hypothetical protein